MIIIWTGVGVTFATLVAAAIAKKKDSVYAKELDQKNPMENKKVVFVEAKMMKDADGVKGHLEAVGELHTKPNFMTMYNDH